MADLLVLSKKSEVKLAFDVHDRFLQLCHTWRRVNGTDLMFPIDLKSDVIRWRTMITRFRNKDFRHREAEMKSTQNVADWTLALNAELKGQPIPVVEWR